ncbi:hypothetical protein F5Y14DRAFT_271270 [Nemania sp. NC0429]|nr:hypothetical protein F5Y14DRAFT_271270 [Nemania sp. NC0429]
MCRARACWPPPPTRRTPLPVSIPFSLSIRSALLTMVCAPSIAVPADLLQLSECERLTSELRAREPPLHVPESDRTARSASVAMSRNRLITWLRLVQGGRRIPSRTKGLSISHCSEK